MFLPVLLSQEICLGILFHCYATAVNTSASRFRLKLLQFPSQNQFPGFFSQSETDCLTYPIQTIVYWNTFSSSYLSNTYADSSCFLQKLLEPAREGWCWWCMNKLDVNQENCNCTFWASGRQFYTSIPRKCKELSEDVVFFKVTTRRAHGHICS